MARTSKLQLVIAGDNKGAVKAVTGTEKALGGLQSKLGGFGAGLAGAFSGAAVIAFAKKSVDAYDTFAGSVAKIKRLTGESAEEASLLAFATQQAGVDAEKAAQGWTILAKNIKNGKVEAAGIAVEDRGGRAREFGDILGDIADKIQALPPGFERTALAQKLFGRGGADMVKILKDGAAGIAANRAEMEKYGLSLDEDGLKKFGEFKAAQRDLSAAMLGVQVAVAEKVVPALSDFFDTMSDGKETLEPVTDAIGSIFSLVPDQVGQAIPLLIGAGLAMKAIGSLGALAAVPMQALGTAYTFVSGTATAAAAGLGVVAGAELTAAETAAAAALAQERLVASWVKGTPAAAGQAAATTSVAAANASASASTSRVGAAAAGASASLGPLAIAATAVGGAFLFTQAQAQHTENNIDSLVAAMEAGVDPIDAFRDKLIRTLAGAQGGFEGIGGSSEKMKESLAQVGVSTEQLISGLTGGDKEFEALTKRIKAFYDNTADQGRGEALVRNLERLRGEGQSAGQVVKDLAASEAELAGETSGAADAADDHASALAREAARMDDVNASAERRAKKAEGILDAQNAVADADRNRLDALAELDEAQQAAAGNSEEYRDATAAIAEAEQGVADAQEAVIEAQRDVTTAQQDLNQARADAVVRLREMAEAERQSKLDAADAALAVKEAQQEQERINADPRASALERERAALAVEQAKEKARQASADAQQAAIDNANAQRAGVDGDKAVVDARQRVVDANGRVRDAEVAVGEARGRVAEATKAANEIIVAAKKREREANRKVTDAVIAEADAYGDLVTLTDGAAAGVDAHREALEKLSAELDPANPLMQRITALMEALRGIPGAANGDFFGISGVLPVFPGSGGTGGGTGGSGGPGGDSGAPKPGGDGPATGNGVGLGSGTTGNVSIVVNNINQGTPTQQRRAQTHATKTTLDELVRAAG